LLLYRIISLMPQILAPRGLTGQKTPLYQIISHPQSFQLLVPFLRIPRIPRLRAYLKIQRGPVFTEKPGWRGATKENIPGGSSTEEQRSQVAFSAKTLRAAGVFSLWSRMRDGSVLTARCGDGPYGLAPDFAASPTAKIPCRRPPFNFQTRSKTKPFPWCLRVLLVNLTPTPRAPRPLRQLLFPAGR
jgi:hypothetical protein